MNILIPGGAGFIGSNLVIRLLDDGHNVYVIDKLTKQVHGHNPDLESYSYNLIKNKVFFIKGDVCNIDVYKSLPIIEFDIILFLVSETGTGQSMYDSVNYCKTNILSFALLNDILISGLIKTKKILLTSSRSVYGDPSIDDNIIPSKETDLVDPKSIYAMTKLAQENLLNTGFNNIHKCIVRLQNVYGPGQSLRNPYTGIISIFTTAIHNNKKIFIFDDGMMSRDFVYIDDVVDAIISVIDNGVDNCIYNIGSGTSTTVINVAEKLKKIYSSNIELDVTGEKLNGDIRHNVADISRIQSLGWYPKYTFDDGISNFTNWAKSEKVYNDNYSISIEELRKSNILKK
jgi:dTDP-L-rhamnose 4-epimerase